MVSIGFYYRQFFFFAAVIGLLTGAGWFVAGQRSHASSSRPISLASADSAEVSMVLGDHGAALINGQVVSGAINFLSNHDELRYVLLDNTDASIGFLTVSVHFPRPVAEAASNPQAIIVHNPSVSYTTAWKDDQTLIYSIQDINPGATVTLTATLPKGVILPSLGQRLFGKVESLPQVIWLVLAVTLPVVTLAILVILAWAALGERLSGTTAQQPSPPDDITPALAGVLVDGRVSARVIAATLLDLARRDYLDIGSVGDTYTFTKRRRLIDPRSSASLAPYEQALLGKIFSAGPQSTEENVRVRIGSTLFSKQVAQIYLGIYEAATDLGYFNENPSVIQGSYRLAGLILFFLGIVGFGFGAAFFSNAPMPLLFWVGTIISALVIIALAPHMPAHTPLGIHKRQSWIAFRNYLRDGRPIDYATQSQELFFAYLPYAVALGAEVEWARRFLRSSFRMPDWYTTKNPAVGLEEFVNDVFPIVGYLARELAAVKEPTLT